MTVLMMTMMALAFTFMWLKHPISMGITIIIQTLAVAMVSGLIMKSFWFSYIITITMLSGMLVLFIYMASVASNEKFNSSKILMMISTMMLITGMIMEAKSESYNDEFNFYQSSTSTEVMSLNILFNSKFKYITMMMVMYLFFTMITVSHITNISEGPLRIKK